MRNAAVVLVVLAGLSLATGCAKQTRPAAVIPPAASVLSTESLPAGGVMATLARPGLSFTAQVSTTTVRPEQTLVATFVLTNTGTKPLRWNKLHMGWSLWVIRARDRTPNELVTTPRPFVRPAGASQIEVLLPGQSISTSETASGFPLGTYRAVPGFDGSSGPAGQTPEIIIRSVTN